MAEAQQRLPETISTQLLFEDLTEELTAWHKFLGPAATLAWLHDAVQTAAQVRAYLRQRLAQVGNPRWQKAPTKKRPPRPPRQYLKGGHSSVYRIERGLHKLGPDFNQEDG